MQIRLPLYISCLCGVSFLVLAGCAPVTPKRDAAASRIESVRSFDSFLQSHTLFTDVRAVQRISRIAHRLHSGTAVKAAWPRIILVTDTVPFALTFSGAGATVLSSALLYTVKSDDELAFILAHEVSHVFAGHTLDARATSAKLRRGFEEEADVSALELVRRAGYDSRRAIVALITVPRAWEITSESPGEEAPLKRYLRLERELGYVGSL